MFVCNGEFYVVYFYDPHQLKSLKSSPQPAPAEPVGAPEGESAYIRVCLIIRVED